MRGFGIPIAPEGTVRRIFFGLATVSLLVASFLFLTIFPPTAFAASVDISWVSNNTKISYQSHEYAKLSATDAAKVPNAGTGKYDYYQWINSSSDPDQAQVVAVDKGKQPKMGNLEIYNYDNSTYSTVSTDANAGSCNMFGGMGWILCPISSGLSDTVDQIYSIIKDFMDVTIFTGKATVAYDLWNYVRVIANVCFVIVFLVIIYSQITGLGISNYGIKSMIPRLLTAAILVNISYWICSLAVDASNLIGHSVYGVFQGIQESFTKDLASQSLGNLGDFDWGEVTVALLAGGTTAVIAGATFYVVGAASLGFMLVSLLVVVAFAALLALVILAARQALILVFTILSPFAFIAMILPKTRDWFDKWMKQFTSLLIFFPMFSLLFGASQVAGQAIIASQIGDATSSGGLKIHMILFGLGIQFMPLVFTPWLIKLSNGILGQIAGMVNGALQKPKGAALGWAKQNREYYGKKAMAHSKGPRVFDKNKIDTSTKRGRAKWLGAGALNGISRAAHVATPRGAAVFADQQKRKRDAMDKVHDQMLQNRFDDTKAGSRVDRARRGTEQEHKTIESRHERHWNDLVQKAQGKSWERQRALRTEMATNKSFASIADESMTNQDEYTFRSNLQDAVNPEYSRYRAMSVQSTFNKNRAEQAKNLVEQQGKLQWENVKLTDHVAKQRAYQESELNDKIQKATKQYEMTIDEIRAQGSAHASLSDPTIPPGLRQQMTNSAAALKDTFMATNRVTERQTSAKDEQEKNIITMYRGDGTQEDNEVNRQAKEYRDEAGGIAGKRGANRVAARTIMQYVENKQKARSNQQALLDGYSMQELFQIQTEGTDPRNGNEEVDEEMRLAALKELVEKRANNMTLRKIRDQIASRDGMVYKDGKYYKHKVDADGEPEYDKRNQPVPDLTSEISAEDVDTHLTRQQVFGAALAKSSNYIADASGSDRNNTENGTLTYTGKYATIRDMVEGKYKQDRLAKTDIDEWEQMVITLRDPTAFNKMVPPEKRDAVKANMLNNIRATLQNPELYGQLEDRAKGMMNAVAAMLDPTDARPQAEKETYFYTVPNPRNPQEQMPIPAPAHWSPGDTTADGTPITQHTAPKKAADGYAMNQIPNIWNNN